MLEIKKIFLKISFVGNLTIFRKNEKNFNRNCFM